MNRQLSIILVTEDKNDVNKYEIQTKNPPV